MRGFELYDAGTVKEAVDLLGKYSGRAVKVVGGGSDIVGGVMKDWVQGKGMPLPEVLIDITTIKDIVGIKTDGGGTTIGAAIRVANEQWLRAEPPDLRPPLGGLVDIGADRRFVIR